MNTAVMNIIEVSPPSLEVMLFVLVDALLLDSIGDLSKDSIGGLK